MSSPATTYERWADDFVVIVRAQGLLDRLLGPGTGEDAPDYLAGYSIELQPQGAGVTWGRVDWEEDPFKDLKCESDDRDGGRRSGCLRDVRRGSGLRGR